MGVGCSGVVTQGAWSCEQNPAGIANASVNTCFGIKQTNHFRIGNWNDVAIGATMGINRRTGAAIRFSQEGIPGYKSSGILAGTAVSITKNWQIGISAGVVSELIGSKEIKAFHLIESHIGTSIDLNRNIKAGLVADNIQGSMKSDPRIPSPASIRSGLSIRTSETFVLMAEAAANNTEQNFSLGCIYQPATNVAIRIGYNTSGRQLSAGLGYKWKKWSIDTAVRYQVYLGSSTSIGISYCHEKKRD